MVCNVSRIPYRSSRLDLQSTYILFLRVRLLCPSFDSYVAEWLVFEIEFSFTVTGTILPIVLSLATKLAKAPPFPVPFLYSRGFFSSPPG